MSKCADKKKENVFLFFFIYYVGLQLSRNKPDPTSEKKTRIRIRPPKKNPIFGSDSRKTLLYDACSLLMHAPY